MARWFALSIALLCVASALPTAAAPRLCPPPRALPAERDDHGIKEQEFTLAQFSRSLSWFQDGLPARLKEAKQTDELTDKSEFWIAYRNGLTFIEGYALKQEALLERAQKRRAGPAVRRFCDFVSKATWVD